MIPFYSSLPFIIHRRILILFCTTFFVSGINTIKNQTSFHKIGNVDSAMKPARASNKRERLK